MTRKGIQPEPSISKVKVTVSIDAALNDSLTEHAARTRTSRSRVIEEALRYWWRWKRHEELVEAYRELRNDSLELAEGNLAAGFETYASHNSLRSVAHSADKR